MRSLVETHDRVKDFDWEPSYSTPVEHYPTKYKIPGKTRDPFRHLVRDYLSMEQEKDDRQYGGLEDALARSGAPAKADMGWMEVMKLALPIVSYAEYGALKCQAQLSDTVENPELRQGYLFQMQDEIRHINQQLYLARYFARHAPDPEGFNNGMKVRNSNIFFRAGRSCFETFFNGDPIECSLSLQVVGETAYTNPLFVALTEVAALNGDQATPSVFLSIQSDESRHMANGYATLAAVLSEAENHEFLQADLDRVFWRNHVFLDPLLATVYDYFGKERTSSYHEKWTEWVAEDWVGSYIGRLEPYGLKPPRWFDQAVARSPHLGHASAMTAAAAWPFMFWRFPQLNDADFEWFEEKYPGWNNDHGTFWQVYQTLCHPAEGMFPFQLLAERPPICQLCHMPCVYPKIDETTLRTAGYNGSLYPFCSEACEFIFFEEPERYLSATPFDVLWDGVGIDEFIIKNGLLRSDGKTLIAQPHCDPELPMWTIDDIARTGFAVEDPLKERKAEYRKAHAAGLVGDGRIDVKAIPSMNGSMNGVKA